MPSDIKVFVRFKERSVFAGEDVQAKITFRNVASISENATSNTKGSQSLDWTARGRAAEHLRPGGNGGPASQNPRQAAISYHGARKIPKIGHRATSSLSIPSTVSSVPRSTSWTGPPGTNSRSIRKHERSVSIISLNSPDVGSEDIQRRSALPGRTRLVIEHGRSTSLQGRAERTDGTYDAGSSYIRGRRRDGFFMKPDSGPDSQGQVQRAEAPSANLVRADTGLPGEVCKASTSFKRSESAHSLRQGPALASTSDREEQGTHRLPNDGSYDSSASATPDAIASLRQPTRVLAGTSVTESNRSSGDFQSLSNNSQETLISERSSYIPERRVFPSPMGRQHHRSSSASVEKNGSEVLLMGYAQVTAFFILDGALVDHTPFEDIKRKGFLGGQGGGGVVGVKTPSNSAGLLGGFNLNSIGSSLGGFLGGSDLSSIREMKGIASSRAIPLLSTPQSLLFVDLKLMPGEEKSFSFRYTLPTGLPASYEGKSIEITYELNVGVQGLPGTNAAQMVRRVNIPFKIYSGVNEEGELFGHDLMQPYVILHDTAQTEAVDSTWNFAESASRAPSENSEAATQNSDLR